jgi:hypothetical protein
MFTCQAAAPNRGFFHNLRTAQTSRKNKIEAKKVSVRLIFVVGGLEILSLAETSRAKIVHGFLSYAYICNYLCI